MKKSANYWVEQLGMKPHPEGGFFKETYRAADSASFDGFESPRSISTGIYFLLTSGNFSAFHRIKSDEMWHFYTGDPLSIFIIHPNGELQEIRLGLDVENGQLPQAVVPAHTWFASRVHGSGDHSMVGCTVAPGFDFNDFEMADRNTLTAQYPKHAAVITALTRI